jgi:signal transduction histidine kinase
MKKLVNNSWLHLIVGSMLLTFLFIQPTFLSVNQFSQKKFNSNLNQKEKLAETKLNELVKVANLKTQITFNASFESLTKKGITFYVVENQKPIYWTSRNIAFSDSLTEFNGDNGIVILKNGWYQYILKKHQQKTYLALIQVKHHYSIENKYLKNNFHRSFHTPANVSINLTKTNNAYAIKSINGKILFYLSPARENTSITQTNWTLIILFFVGFLLLFSFFSKQIHKIVALQKISPLIIIVAVGIIWLIITHYNVPQVFFQQELFNPAIYAHSSLLPSLGHFLVLVIFFTTIIFYLSKIVKTNNLQHKGIAVFAVFLVAFLPLVFSDWTEGLIKNSTLIFDTSYLFELTVYSFIGIFLIILLFISFTIFIQLVINTFSNKSFKDYQLNTLLIIIPLVFVIIGHYFFNTHIYLSLWGIAYVLINIVLKNSKNAFYKSITVVTLASLTLSYGFIHFGQEKGVLKKEFLAKKLAKEKDPVAEYLFEEISQKIEADTLIQNNISNYLENKQAVDNHIIKNYFGGFWKKYDVNIIGACQNNDTILIEPDNIDVHCLSFFKEKVEKEADNPFNINTNFNFLYSEEGLSSYLAKLQIKDINYQNNWFLFIEFLPKVFSKTEGYPELLLNQKEIETIAGLNHYSFAKYKNGKLVNNSGNYSYSLVVNKKYHFNDAGYFSYTSEGNNHLLFQSDKNTIISISSPQKTIFNYITTFSYLFLISFILVLFIGVLLKIPPFNWQIAYTDFSTKIQLFIIASIFLSFILFGWGTSYYIKKQYQEKNKKNITEKVQSVLIELEHKLGAEKNLTAAYYSEMTYYLVKFSNVFFTDINLYDKNGILLASSRPEIFNIGLISDKMEPNAYRQLHLNKKSAFIHQEKIGGLNYLSAYVPFRNENNKILAYMNLPYFAKQNELEKDLSTFFTALLNVYGLLFLISAIIAVFFANYISEPLRMIKDKIGALQLGKSYDQIDWQSNDEIGSLVLEYNKKVLELEHSAQLLIKSERESAWREMAKQVAHEIKNPLTPMKLSIQQLQRIASDNPDDLTERIDRTAKTLIEQIETLTKIANEFSSFAKMPKANDEEVNLIPIIETTIDLYQKENVELSLNENCNGVAKIIADKDQILRVFNNLIKNAIQAIPKETKGQISVLISHEEENFLIKIKDNGIGIPSDKKSKIFVPNFTTKSTGMGLGLAMVKNIVEAANGQIWFETEENVGTTFFIKFPSK